MNPVPTNSTNTSTAATAVDHGHHETNLDRTAFAKITTVTGPYSTTPSRQVIAPRIQPSQTPRARLAAYATLTSPTTTTAAITRPHQSGNSMATVPALRPAPVR